MEYEFDLIRSIKIKNPDFVVDGIDEIINGRANVNFTMSLDNLKDSFIEFKGTFFGFRTDGNHTEDELNDWVVLQLNNYKTQV